MPTGIYKHGPLSEDHKRKIGLANTIALRGNIPWNKGVSGVCKPNSGSFKDGHNKGKKTWNAGKPWLERRGSGNPNWKGGTEPEKKRIRKSIEYRLWREAVFTRDNWTCQKYGVRGVRLHPHHIQNFSQYPELRFAIDNGVTLSDKAHKEFHSKYGQKNNTKEQLMEFLEQNEKPN
jgi:hypothetical protein